MLATRRSLAAVSLTLLAACAHGGTKAKTDSPRIEPPQMIGRVAPETRGAFDATIEVMVDANGQVDERTIRITGNVNSANLASLERWVREARFAPARQNGRPVAALYKTRLRGRVVRMG